MQTSPRELVQNTLKFHSPERIPRQLWVLPWAEQYYPDALIDIQRAFPDDITASPSFLQQSPHRVGDPYAAGRYVDEWGCTFVNAQAGIIGQVKEPLIGEWSEPLGIGPQDKADKVRIPREHLSVDIESVNAFCRATDQFVLAGLDLGSLPRPFERLQFIRGTTNVFFDFSDHPTELLDLLHQIHQFYKDVLDVWVSSDVDAIWFMDDWGSQRSLLISPDLWREIFKPLYKDYIDIAHQHGKFAFMHSDGYILDILPDLIELGLDAINAQIFCMAVEKLRPFAGQITFWGEIDRQHFLSSGTPSEVAMAVRGVRENLYKDGGVIAQCEFGPGAKPENVYAVFDAWSKVKST